MAENAIDMDMREGSDSFGELREISSHAVDVTRETNAPKPSLVGGGKKEWASTLLLVEEACESIKASEDRVEALERELELAMSKSREEGRQFAARLQAAQEEIQLGQARLKAMEARAIEAEGWLNKLNDAIVANFGGVAKVDGHSTNSATAST